MKMLGKKTINLLLKLVFVLALVGFTNASEEENHTVIMDDNNETTLISEFPLNLEEGYQINLTSFSPETEKLSIELSKDGQALATEQVGIGDTYVYKKDLGEEKNVTILEVRFKNSFQMPDGSVIATVDRIWQISEK